MKHPRFITLTYAGHHSLSSQAKNDLRSCLHLLLQHLRRKNKINSYVCALEVKRNPDGYYLHLHLIYDGQFIPFGLLQSLWKKYTKTSHRVHITAVRDRIRAISYLTDYVCKGSVLSDLSVWDYLPIMRMRFFSSWCRACCKPVIIRELWEGFYCPICDSRLLYNRWLSLEESGIPPPPDMFAPAREKPVPLTDNELHSIYVAKYSSNGCFHEP
jgi:hypothetical protein